jgi:hypothetical protein
MEFQFKPKLSVVLALLKGVAVGLAYIVSQGNTRATIMWFAITTGATAGLSYSHERLMLFSQRPNSYPEASTTYSTLTFFSFSP